MKDIQEKIMETEHLNQILEQSKLYWLTSGKKGTIANLSDANLSDANLHHASLSGANLSDANLRGADMGGANLSDANLVGANLRGADMSGANLVGANLRGADLRDANLSDANLYHASLSGANLVRADLCRADLRDANLSGANLVGADMGDANLYSANLCGADMGGGGRNTIDPSVFGIASVDPTLPLQVAKRILDPESLNMATWHTCKTMHCLAGWAIHLSGVAGYALESVTSASVAGCMLMPSASHLFYSTNGEAIEWAKSVVAESESESEVNTDKLMGLDNVALDD